MPPRISIILSTYNQVDYLAEAIASVIAQTYTDWELLLIDDASSQAGTQQIIQQYADLDARITPLRNIHNLWLTTSLNKCIVQARGQYIARIDDDDVWIDRDKLSKQLAYMEQHPDCAVIGTQAVCVDGKGCSQGCIRVQTSDAEIRQRMLWTNQFVHASVLIRKSCLDLVGPYSSSWDYVEDYELWLRLGTQFQLANLADTCVAYRILGSSITRRKNSLQNTQILGLIKQYRANYPRARSAYFLRFLMRLTPVCVLEFLRSAYRKFI